VFICLKVLYKDTTIYNTFYNMYQNYLKLFSEVLNDSLAASA